MSELGIVVIGRNEGERLHRCLESVAVGGRPVVYVDSGSTDGSVELARSRDVEVVELDMTSPFTAARARNEGVDRLVAIAPGVRFVQFVDGDCEVVPGWLDRGQAELEARPEVAVVCGRLRERFPERSIYNRLADLEWDKPIGEVAACGGIAMMRLDALRASGGFDPTLIAGEEPELCLRLRRWGWKVLRIDAEMALHDIAMTRFSQWWRRAVRFGYGSLDVVLRGEGRDGPYIHQVRSVWIWTIGWVLAMLATCLVGGIFNGRVGLAAAAMTALAPVIQAARMAAMVSGRVEGVGTVLGHGGLTMVGKWAQLVGHIRRLLDHDGDRRRGTGLVDYKRSTAGLAEQGRTG
jgi:glycosyltransferase involved in cell wall biosynthesis